MFHRLRLILKDCLRFARPFQLLFGLAQLVRARFVSTLPQRLERLANAYRIVLAAGKPEWAEPALRAYVEDPQAAPIWREEQIGWTQHPKPSESAVISKSVILKRPIGDREKGVLFVSFEYNLYPLLTLTRLKPLLREYTIVSAPSWSPPSFPILWSAAHLPDADIFFTISNERDVEWLQRFKTGTGVAPILVSHWVNPDVYRPRPHKEREIDILMVANWASFKRHWVLFNALRRMPRTRRAVLVGQPDSGRTVDDVAREAELFGVRDRVEFRNRLGIEEVTELQCNSRVSLVCSRREGSCVVVAESLFADAPCGLLRGAHIGSTAFINEQTGVLLEETNLARDLERFLERSGEFQAREWALQNISCHDSSVRLNTQLREHALKKGQEWTVDLAPMCCRPNPMYVRPADRERLSGAYADISGKFGLKIEGI